MIPIYIFVEDWLSDVVIRKILQKSKNEFEVTGSIEGGCHKIKSKIAGINKSARGMPFMVLIDLDNEQCAPTLISKWFSNAIHPNLIFCVAVREVESWVMADIKGFSNFLGVNPSVFPLDMDAIDDPKQFLIQKAKKSKRKNIKEAIVPKAGSGAMVGPDYNGTLIRFVTSFWDIQHAIQHSNSLKHTVRAIDNFSWTSISA